MVIIYFLCHETLRFSQLKRKMPQVTEANLTKELRMLEQYGLVHREIYREVPPRVEYSITEKGRSLEHILELMCEWGEKNIDDRFIMTNPQCNDNDSSPENE